MQQIQIWKKCFERKFFIVYLDYITPQGRATGVNTI